MVGNHTEFCPFANTTLSPDDERGELVQATRDLDPRGADVKKGDLGVVFEPCNYYGDECGPMARFVHAGMMNIYIDCVECLDKPRSA